MTEQIEKELGFKMTISGAVGCKKIREFFCENEECEAFECSWELSIRDNERYSQKCPICEQDAKELIGCLNGWRVLDDEEKKEQLKKRSKDHMAWCHKKGIHPNDTGYSPGPRDWVNKTRAKNTSSRTISDFKYAHKDWVVGKELINH